MGIIQNFNLYIRICYRENGANERNYLLAQMKYNPVAQMNYCIFSKIGANANVITLFRHDLVGFF
jgi:hypothetical protein